MHWAAIILAAGFSTRMGRSKVLLPWRKTTVIGHLLDQYTRLGAEQIGVVMRVEDRPLQGELERLHLPTHDRIINPSPGRGMFGSVQCAACWRGWKSGMTHWLVSLGDQPHLKDETVKAVIEFGEAHPGHICQPFQGGHRRHPIWLPAAHFAQLQSTSASTLKDFLDQNVSSSAFCESTDAGLELDIDYPADYERALGLCSDLGP